MRVLTSEVGQVKGSAERDFFEPLARQDKQVKTLVLIPRMPCLNGNEAGNTFVLPHL